MKMLTPLLLWLSSTFVLYAQVPPTGIAGAFQVGIRDVTFTDASLLSPSVDARVWYPATVAGTNALPANGLFPVVVFGHGFNLDYLDYELLCSHLASWGYCVLSPDVQNGFTVDHLEFAKELGACLNYMQSEGAASSSDFYQLVDTMTGVLGHSMGGGASALVPSVYPSIDAVSGLAAAETTPSAISALGSYSGPYQVISGDEDNTAPESSNQGPMYTAALGSKQWLSLIGGAHCKFTDVPTLCDLVSGAGTISRPTQVYLTKKYTTAFFNFFLKNDQDALPFLCGDSVVADVSTATVSLQTTLNCTALATASPLDISPVISPNPSTGTLRVTTLLPVQLFTANGHALSVPQTIYGELTLLDLTTLSPGLYFLRTEGAQTVQRILLQ